MCDIRDGTDCGESLLYKGKCEFIGKEVQGFEQLKTTSEILVKASQWSAWFMLLLLGVTALFPIYWCTCGRREHQVLGEEMQYNGLK